MDPFLLNLRHIRALPLVSHYGNMSAAAAAAHLSQPALTQGLAKIESILGVRLYDRTPGGMVETPAGRRFVARVPRAMEQLAGGCRPGMRGVRGFASPDRLMTSTQLRAFLLLAASGSYVEAARSTNGSQPAIHRAVRDLEQIIGLRLVERRGRSVALSEAGKRLARVAGLARAELAAAIDDLAPADAMRGQVAVGAMPLCRARLLPAAIALAMKRAPLARFDIVEGAWRELVEPLRDGQLDLMVGALREMLPPPDLDQQPLFVDHVAIVARAGHPLAAGGPPDLAALSAYPWIIGRERAPLRDHWNDLFAGREPPHAPVECGSVMTIRGLLLDTDCLTLLSPSQVAVEVDAGLLTLIAPPGREMARVIGVTTRRDWRPTNLQAILIEALAEAHRLTS